MRRFDESSCCRFLSFNALITFPNTERLYRSPFGVRVCVCMSLSLKLTPVAVPRDASPEIADNFPTLAVI